MKSYKEKYIQTYNKELTKKDVCEFVDVLSEINKLGSNIMNPIININDGIPPKYKDLNASEKTLLLQGKNELMEKVFNNKLARMMFMNVDYTALSLLLMVISIPKDSIDTIDAIMDILEKGTS